MSLTDNTLTTWWKQYGQHIVAFIVVVLLLASAIGLYTHNKLQEEINENCGWGEDDYYCFCEKSTAMEMRNNIDDGIITINLDP